MKPLPAAVLVTDFDGTMTRHDFYQRARARWWDERDGDPWQDYLAGRVSHFDALNRFFARVQGDASSLDSFLDELELDPTLPAAVERLHEAGWHLIIVSAGCEWYIRRLLVKVRTPWELHANPGCLLPGGGLEMQRPVDSPFYCPRVGIDKAAVMRDALRRFEAVAFAGDGPPDVAPARLVKPELRWARGYLAETLKAEGEAFLPLSTWSDLADHLLHSSGA